MAIVAVARLALKVHQCYHNATGVAGSKGSSSGSGATSSSNGRKGGNQQQQQQQIAAVLRTVAEQLLLSIGVSESPENAAAGQG
jgi:hypothetical protein